MYKKILPWFLGLFGLLFAIAIGLWSKNLFTQSESVHFSVNFPTSTGEADAKTMNCCDFGGPWASIPEKDWKGYPAGGVLVWGTEGTILLDVGREGFLKRTIQPGFINLSTHWLRNVGIQPYYIRLDMDLCGIDLHWETFESAWDPTTQSTTRAINPGEVYNMDWYFHIPPEMLNQAVVCEGQLKVFDAQAGDSLTELPIVILNSRSQ